MHIMGNANKALRNAKAAAHQDKSKQLGTRVNWRDKRNILGTLISGITGLATMDDFKIEKRHLLDLEEHVKKALQHEMDMGGIISKMRHNQTKSYEKMAEVLYMAMGTGGYWSRRQWRVEQVTQSIDELYGMVGTAYAGYADGATAARIIAQAGGRGTGHVQHVEIVWTEQRVTHRVFHDIGIDTVGMMMRVDNGTLLTAPEAQYRLAPDYDPKQPLSMYDVMLTGTGSKDNVGLYHLADGTYKATHEVTLECISSKGIASVKRVKSGQYLWIDKQTSCKGPGFGFGEKMYSVEHKNLLDLPAIHPTRIKDHIWHGTLAYSYPKQYGYDKIQAEIQNDIAQARSELADMATQHESNNYKHGATGIVAIVGLVVAGSGTLIFIGVFIKIKWTGKSHNRSERNNQSGNQTQ